MADLRELYQEVILDHTKRPRNRRIVEAPNHEAEGHNPVCGDAVRVFLRVEDGVIRDISFQGQGCAISTASASMMTERLKGRSVAEAQAIFEQFHELVAGTAEEPADSLGKLAVFAGVREFPVRVKCATLPWHTLKAALADQKELVSTE